MRPRNLARPAAAGALCFAMTCAVAQTLRPPSPKPILKTETAAPAAQPRDRRPTERRLDVRAGGRTAVARQDRARPSPGSPSRCRSGAGSAGGAIDRDRTDAAGRFQLRRARSAARAARACVIRIDAAPGVRAAPRAGLGRLNVYLDAHASWYGPGLYGNRTGCGGTLLRRPARRGATVRHRPAAPRSRSSAAHLFGAGSGDRSRPLRRRARVRPHRGDRRAARLPRSRRRARHALADRERELRRRRGQRRLCRARRALRTRRRARQSRRTGRGGA